eukprot:6209381-Prymnesium_polylepis.1
MVQKGTFPTAVSRMLMVHHMSGVCDILRHFTHVCEIKPRSPAPRASPPRGRPGVLRTPGITAAAAAPGVAITVMPRVGPTPPRARSTVLLTSMVGDEHRVSVRLVLAAFLALTTLALIYCDSPKRRRPG